jgi:hypothetical protein
MPYNLVPVKIANGAVLPQALCSSFVETYQYPVLATDYNDGSHESSLIVDGVNAPRYLRTFVLSRRLTTAQLAALSNFWATVAQGGLYPFYFYNPFDVAPIGSNYDPTGTNINGRVPVFFRGDWAQTTALSRHTVSSLMLVETADLVEEVTPHG